MDDIYKVGYRSSPFDSLTLLKQGKKKQPFVLHVKIFIKKYVYLKGHLMRLRFFYSYVTFMKNVAVQIHEIKYKICHQRTISVEVQHTMLPRDPAGIKWPMI